MEGVIGRALSRFGAIDGVFHAAGVPDVGLTQMKTLEEVAKVLAPKVKGTLVLEQVLQNAGVMPDFMVLFSSIVTATGGGPGQIAYCAANAFLDSYAHSRIGNDPFTVAIDWSEWQWNSWEDCLSAFGDKIRAMLADARRRYGISFEEGNSALDRILSHDFCQVLVSTRDLTKILDAGRQFTLARIVDAQDESARSARHRRPPLMTPYVQPASKMDQRVAAIWESIMSIDRIGVRDNFFELGGHSLAAVRLVTQLREAFHINLPVSAVLANPTIEDLAVVIEAAAIEKIERMTDEEASLYLRELSREV
jgi:acyl carrier protein